MPIDDEADHRLRTTLGHLTEPTTDPPPLSSLIGQPRHGKRGLAIAAVLSVAIVTAFGWLLIDRATESDGSASCAPAVELAGRRYVRDRYNSGVLTRAELGPVIGTVEREHCAIPRGTEIYSVEGERAQSVVATTSGDTVVLFRSNADHLAFQWPVVEIQINSEHDGTTEFASINDTGMIHALLEDLRATAIEEVDVDWTAPRLFIAFIRDDGLRVVLPYHQADAVLGVSLTGGSRHTSAVWQDAVQAALARSPAQPTVSEPTLVGVLGEGRFHPNGRCRHDRPDLTVSPQESLNLSGSGAVDVLWLLQKPYPGPFDEAAWEDLYEQRIPTLALPRFDGTMIIELYLLDTGGIPKERLCMTLVAQP